MNVTKVMKYQILYIDDDVLPYKDFMNCLKDLQNEMFRISNRVIQLHWEFSGYESDYKKRFDAYPDKQATLDDLGYTNVRSFIYNEVSKSFYKNNKGNVSSALQKVDKKYRSEKKEYYAGKKSIPSFRSDIPVELHKGSIKIDRVKGKSEIEYIVTISLLSNAFKKEIGSSVGAFRFKIMCKDPITRTILSKICDGEYSHTSSSLKIKNGKTFLHLGYNFQSECNKAFVEGRIMGVDMGIAYPAYMSFNDCRKQEKILPGEIEAFRLQMDRRRRSVYSQTKHCGEGKIGHGYKTRTKGADKLKEKESNFRNRINHQYSRFIVDFAYKNNCGVIQMEDLSGISKNNTFLKNWTYFDLQSKIEYKAAEKGIKVIKVNPKYTSQRCSKCGYIDKENRESQSEFVCKCCGFRANADFNASQNLSIDGIERIIEQALKYQSANTK